MFFALTFAIVAASPPSSGAPSSSGAASSSAASFFSASARGTLQWRASFEPCVKGAARVRLSLVDAAAADAQVKSSLLLEDVTLRCPTTRAAEPKPRAHDGVVLWGAPAGPLESSDALDVGSIALGHDRRGVVVVYETGAESIGFDHALYVEEDGAIKRAWQVAHHGFEMGVVEDQFEIEPADATGAEHIVAAFQRLSTEHPLDRSRIGYDVDKKRATEQPLPYFLVIAASDQSADVANKRLDEWHAKDCRVMFAFVGDSAHVPGLKPGLVVTGFPASTKKEADDRLADVKKCAPDAYIKEVR